MGTFLRSKFGLSNEQGFVQGAGRILVNSDLTVIPDGIEDFVNLTAGATIFDPAGTWTDVGFTKTGINITRNNSEETFDVDQYRGDIKRRPSNWEMSVGTQLAEATLETFQRAWTLGAIAAVSKTGGQRSERQVGLGAPSVYQDLQVCVLFQFPLVTGTYGIIRAWWFRHCQIAAQESGFTLQKTGEQVSLPTRWNALADPAAPEGSEFGMILEQTGP